MIPKHFQTKSIGTDPLVQCKNDMNIKVKTRTRISSLEIYYYEK